jgi:shikimate kinase
MRNITLIGFMGTGKTVVAREVAKACGLRYVSTDDLIEKREGMKIADIFAKKGEPYFRDIEAIVARKVSAASGQVIDAGGGIVTREESIAALKKNGIIICLTARVDVLHARTRGRTHRPLLNCPDPKARIGELLKTRAPFYAKADMQIDTSDLSIAQVVETVVKIVQGSE